MLIRRIARPLLATVFIGQGVDSLRDPQAAAEAARPTVTGLRTLPDPVAAKIPTDAKTLARINAGVQIGGGMLLATGKMPRAASAALACTVIPGNLGAHMFWNETDPERRTRKRRDFLADLSLLGGLLIAAADTAGKPSLGWRGRRAAERIPETVSAAFPWDTSHESLLDSEPGEKIEHGLQAGAERGRELASVAGEKSAPLVAAARKRGSELAGTARHRGADLAETARHRGAHLADTARTRSGELAMATRERVGAWRGH